MATRNRVTLTLDDDTHELMQRLAAQTHMTPAAIVCKLIPAHLAELWEYVTWMEQLPVGANPTRNRGSYALQNYGPNDLISEIKKIDQNYKTEGQRFQEGISK